MEIGDDQGLRRQGAEEVGAQGLRGDALQSGGARA